MVRPPRIPVLRADENKRAKLNSKGGKKQPHNVYNWSQAGSLLMALFAEFITGSVR